MYIIWSTWNASEPHYLTNILQQLQVNMLTMTKRQAFQLVGSLSSHRSSDSICNVANTKNNFLPSAMYKRYIA